MLVIMAQGSEVKFRWKYKNLRGTVLSLGPLDRRVQTLMPDPFFAVHFKRFVSNAGGPGEQLGKDIGRTVLSLETLDFDIFTAG